MAEGPVLTAAEKRALDYLQHPGSYIRRALAGGVYVVRGRKRVSGMSIEDSIQVRQATLNSLREKGRWPEHLDR